MNRTDIDLFDEIFPSESTPDKPGQRNRNLFDEIFGATATDATSVTPTRFPDEGVQSTTFPVILQKQ